MEYNKDNIFAKILRRELPAKIVYEDEIVLAFHDAFPVAQTHILVIPKGEYINFADFITNAAEEDIVHYYKKIKEIASLVGLEDYRIQSNSGPSSGQTVFHFHTHIMSGI